jgi:hypothetical protein
MSGPSVPLIGWVDGSSKAKAVEAAIRVAIADG